MKNGYEKKNKKQNNSKSLEYFREQTLLAIAQITRAPHTSPECVYISFSSNVRISNGVLIAFTLAVVIVVVAVAG